MKNAPLTARYRPQSFAEVAGQETIKTILSRAAAEDRVAPAYLFSGTRGVGKTTIARIFAKALNCRKAPAAEPCNECDLCRAVTQGAAIDVVEIDGASNRGIDDVRRLKEVVGYAPMDGRYKVFIIDEAHMLSRDAFNALLKTLEEPPAGVTFIMATTEPHKFPATVVSRCQHFVFKRLSEHELMDHLTHVLQAENITFEPAAVRLIARRGAGSVRDSMSLLGQVLALGTDSLTQETARSVLGLAGQETFMALLESIRQGNTLELVRLLRAFLEQGLDIGFFLRELANYWREMFILRQTGEAGLAAVDMPEDEARLMLDMGQKFSLPHIHACWQMTLEGQRRVQSSLEPGLALELLLLNLAMLPQLMPLDALSSLARRAHIPPAPQGATASGASQASPISQASPASPGPEGASSPSEGGAPRGEPSAAVSDPPLAAADPSHGSSVSLSANFSGSPSGNPSPEVASEASSEVSPEIPSRASSEASLGASLDVSPDTSTTTRNFPPDTSPATSPATSLDTSLTSVEVESPLTESGSVPEGAGPPRGEGGQSADNSPPPVSSTPTPPALLQVSGTGMAGSDNEDEDEEEGEEFGPSRGGAILPSWGDIVARAQAKEGLPWFAGLLQSISGAWEGKTLVLRADSDFSANKIAEPMTKKHLEDILQSLLGVVPPMRIDVVKEAVADNEAIKEAMYANPTFKDLEEILSVRIIDFGRIHK